jgi:hypothetical protein
MVDTLHTHTKPLRTLMLVSVRRFPNIARQGDPVDLRCRLGARHLGLKPLQPPHHRCNTNGKPGRHLGYCKPFLLSHRENLTAKIKGVCHAPNIIILCGIGYTLHDDRGLIEGVRDNDRELLMPEGQTP